MAIELDMPAGGIHGENLLAELQAAGVPATAVSVTGAGLVAIGCAAIYKVAARNALVAHKRPADVRARDAAAIAADVEKELVAQHVQGAKVLAGMLGRMARSEPKLLSDLGLSTSATEEIP